ncbi:sulfite oxidase heme-binding subunit YedZ [Zavarzinia sp. CC-PAN008]|uniref:sulfite oxidase heme-binding subunit YedZ n=1 Tax=Zavarzinia sp. CC-PAN008 TaxID=3243332 RepID=UPI003F7486A7
MTLRLPWNERNGRFSGLKAATFAALFLPALWVAWQYQQGMLGARPLDEAIHQTGSWTIRLLFVSLAVTPLRPLWRMPRLLVLRRMLGVAAFAYGLLHLALYAIDQSLDLVRIAVEIVSRIYLTIGFVALLGLAILAATSTDAQIRRLGPQRWGRLHALVYPIGVLALVHHYMQAKIDVAEPLVMTGLFVWLMAWRFLPRAKDSLGALLVLAALCTIATALGEGAYFMWKANAPLDRVLAANWSWAGTIRPAWVVGGILAAVLAIAGARRVSSGVRSGGPRIPARSSTPDR